VLSKQPAERSLPRFATLKPVATLRQDLGQLGEAPGRKFADIADHAHNFEIASAREQDVGESRFSIESLRGKQRTVFGRPLLQPATEAFLVDEVDRPALLLSVGDQHG
jgi:hypothetical protein